MRCMSLLLKLEIWLVVLMGMAMVECTAQGASVNSNSVNVTLNASMAESITVSLTLGTVTFALANATTVAGSAAVPITTSWALQPSRTSVKLYGSFASSAAAMTDGYSTPDNIPAADILGEMVTGNPITFTAFSQTNSGFGAASASLLLFNQPVSLVSANFVSTRTDLLLLEIVTPGALPAGSYSGTMVLQAQAN